LQSADTSAGVIRIGARGSPLALAQAEAVRRAFAAAGSRSAETMPIVPITTTGDRITDRPLAEAGGKGLFTKEIDEALIAGRIDAAVHSAKDMPTRLPDGIMIAACLKRGDARDALVSPRAQRLADLPAGARVGTSSPRRKALALMARPDLSVVDLRGNVETRLRKVDDGSLDAAILAVAGLTRLGLGAHVTSIMESDDWLPAVGQGAIAVATRADDERTRKLMSSIDDRDSSIALAAERAFLAALGGSCRTPIGGLATIAAGRLVFRGIILKPDGSDAHTVRRDGPASDAERIGGEAGAELAARGGADFFSAM